MQLIRRLLLINILAFGISGCGTTPSSQLYLLSANATTATTEIAEYNIHIGLGPIELPAYLKRKQIVIMTSDNSLHASEYHRWAEPLEMNFARVVAQNLSIALPNADISKFPRLNNNQLDVQARIQVLRFDTDSSNVARLSVRWELIDKNNEMLHPTQSREFVNQASSKEYEALVQALSECVSDFSNELAETIKQIKSNN